MACPWSCACDPPPTLIEVASNTRPCSKLGGITLNGREEGGQYYISQTCDQERFEVRKVIFSWECLNSFATGCSSKFFLQTLIVLRMYFRISVTWNELEFELSSTYSIYPEISIVTCRKIILKTKLNWLTGSFVSKCWAHSAAYWFSWNVLNYVAWFASKYPLELLFEQRIYPCINERVNGVGQRQAKRAKQFQIPWHSLHYA